jgi:hypothetical protein
MGQTARGEERTMTRTCVALLAATLVGVSAPTGQAQPPSGKNELVRLIPPDVSVCLTIDDVAGMSNKTVDPRWIGAVQELPLGKALGDAPQLLQLDLLRTYVHAQIGVDWAELSGRLGADGIVLAYRAGTANQPAEESGLLLIHSKDRDALAKLVEHLTALKAQGGQIATLARHEYKGLQYLERAPVKGGKFLFVDGSTLAVSNQESMIRSVLDCHTNPKHVPPAGLKRGSEPGPRNLATVWLNPRGMEGELRAEAERLGATPEGHSLKTFLTYWKAIDGLSLALRDGANPELAIALHARSDKLPPAARKVVQDAIHPSDCWRRFPTDSIMIAAGQSDLRALAETLGNLAPDGDAGLLSVLRKGVGLPMNQEMFQFLAPSLGPDWGFCVTASQAKTDFPHVVFAAKVRTAPGRPEEALGVLNSVRLMTLVGMADYNNTHKDQVQLKTITSYRGDIHCLVNDERYPKGFRPCFSLRENYLLLASSPEAIEKFKLENINIAIGPKPGVKPMGSGGTVKPAIAKMAAPLYPVVTTPLARISCQRLADLMKERREAMLHIMAKHRAKGEKDAEARFQSMAATLGLFDQIDFIQQTQGDMVTWILRVQTSGAKN